MIKLEEQPENVRVSFYGALFAVASADGTIDKEEVESIFESLDLDGLSEEARRTVLGYLIQPPEIESCLNALRDTPDELRYGIMINLVEVAHADDHLDEREMAFIRKVKGSLKVSDEQLEKILDFVKEARRIRERGLDDNVAADAMKRAASGLAGVGIPIAAVYFSGSVIGLSAAGITSGLAALGLGLGMVPGIGVAILIGTVVAIGVSKSLDVGGKRKKAKIGAERERKAQLVIKNLQETINAVIDHVNKLRTAADETAANRKAIETLTQRLKTLQQALAKRQCAMGVA